MNIVHEINTEANRQSIKYQPSEQIKRVLWMMIRPLFRWSPRPMFGWRNFILRSMGATIGKGVRMYSSTSVYFPWNLRLGNYVSLGEHALIYNLGPVFIDDHVTVSQRAHVCAGSHDYTRPEMPLEKPPVSIGRHAWICADAFIGPNVHIEEGAVVAARAVVVKNVSAWDVVGGNPAKFIKKRVLVS